MIIKEATKLPNVIKKKDLLKDIPNKKAHKQAVQVPVKGRGIATKIKRARSL